MPRRLRHQPRYDKGEREREAVPLTARTRLRGRAGAARYRAEAVRRRASPPMATRHVTPRSLALSRPSRSRRVKRIILWQTPPSHKTLLPSTRTPKYVVDRPTAEGRVIRSGRTGRPTRDCPNPNVARQRSLGHFTPFIRGSSDVRPSFHVYTRDVYSYRTLNIQQSIRNVH